MGVMWSVIGCDWKLPAPVVAERVLSRVGDGGIICLHDGRGTLKDPDIRLDSRSGPANCSRSCSREDIILKPFLN